MKTNPLIPVSTIAGFAELDSAYQALQSAIQSASEAEELAKQARSNLCENPEFLAPPERLKGWSPRDLERHERDHIARKTVERDRRRLCFFVCYLRAVRCGRLLHAAITESVTAVVAVRSAIDALPATPSLEKQCAMANCFLVDALILQARKLEQSLSREWSYYLLGKNDEPDSLRYGPETIYLVPGVACDLHQLLETEYKRTAREWVVLCGVWGFPEVPNPMPSGPYLTRDEASWEGGSWIGYADTVGGTAGVFNVRTGAAETP